MSEGGPIRYMVKFNHEGEVQDMQPLNEWSECRALIRALEARIGSQRKEISDLRERIAALEIRNTHRWMGASI